MNSLDSFFYPSSIALIGATDRSDSVGQALALNLSSFPGDLYFVNPNRQTLYNEPCYPSIESIEPPIDLAVVAIKAPMVPKTVEQLGRKGVRAAIILSAGFKEEGEAGKKLEEETLSAAKKGNVRLIGPNCLGLLFPATHLNASFAPWMPVNGKAAFISQSGALCTSLLDYAKAQGIGFRAFISIGSMADLEFADFIEYFSEDRETSFLLLYIENLGDYDRFLYAAKRCAKKKPIIALKPGRSKAAAQAAASHTGSLIGSDHAVETFLQESLILRANTLEDFFDLFSYYSLEKEPLNDRIAIITNAGGLGVLATDAIELGGAISLPPIDLLGDASSADYEKACKEVHQAQKAGSIIAIASPQSMTAFDKIAEVLIEQKHSAPLVTSFLSNQSQSTMERLKEQQLLSIPAPDRAAKLLTEIISYRKRVKYALSRQDHHSRKKREIPSFHSTSSLISEYEAKSFLKKEGFPVVETYLVTSPEELLNKSKEMEFPLCLKLHSLTISHKTDVNGVFLNLKTQDELLAAYKALSKIIGFEGATLQKMIPKGIEVLFGSIRDPEVGPLVSFGSGGVWVELYKDIAFAIPPLSEEQCLDLFKKTEVSSLLQGYRNQEGVDQQQLADLFARFSNLIYDCPWIVEMDLNPVVLTKKEIYILDARIRTS